ncbi:hypothetical protein IAQ61_005844 [Plenodomus lingam]|uniref:Predicted protein n=1 Tax=Leptosphaeria maculans (strain JN3 / isolate v23.1.3 / race Av1-4-5-6-7-8) TaxID=985895 RepID=E4ZLW4_LEPMJ|nr:predicted protein [Plenodomus lingam JN3]KAH9870370.1 hypothetical protein IAQ61_005844 [Plenodomus lingam]CBX92794.1 predicted protein [Plenodomus lingam JN3]
MSTAISSPLPTPSNSPPCSTADFTQFPTTDIACAVGSTTSLPANTSAILSSCCHSAPVEPFNGDCGFYCLSVDQPVSELQACFMQGGVNPASIFCSGNNSATATGRPDATGSATRSGGATATGGSEGVGSRVGPGGMGKSGLGVLGLVFAFVIAGAVL